MKYRFVILSLLLLLFTSCRKQPDNILSEERMENLLVDIHKTEAVITLNHSKYPSDDKKRSMREAVFMRHNTTQEEFDTSLEWYGKNINVYMEIYDRVIERLKKENEIVKELIAQEDAQILTHAGDSVDIWKQQRHHIFNADKAENVLAFNITSDENFQRSDRFILRYHIVNAPRNGVKPRSYLAVRHNRHVIHYNYADVSGNGWNSLSVQSDSASNINEVYGYIAMPPRSDRHIMYIDSIELIRIHNRPGLQRYEYKVMEPLPERTGKPETKKTKPEQKKKSEPAKIKKQELKEIKK